MVHSRSESDIKGEKWIIIYYSGDEAEEVWTLNVMGSWKY